MNDLIDLKPVITFLSDLKQNNNRGWFSKKTGLLMKPRASDLKRLSVS